MPVLEAKKAEDSLEKFARQFGRQIAVGEEVIIPEKCLGIDPVTKVPRSKYAAKKALKRMTDRIFPA